MAVVSGRRQYLYHQQWQDERSEEKFDRVLDLSATLPQCRSRIAADLRIRGLSRDRVLTLGLRLLDLGYFRAGGDQYAEEHNSFGIATLLGSTSLCTPTRSSSTIPPRVLCAGRWSSKIQRRSAQSGPYGAGAAVMADYWRAETRTGSATFTSMTSTSDSRRSLVLITPNPPSRWIQCHQRVDGVVDITHSRSIGVEQPGHPDIG